VKERAPAAYLCLRPKHRQLAAVRHIFGENTWSVTRINSSMSWTLLQLNV
jgi:hypothetical protein